MEKTLAIASLNDEASMVCMDSSSSCILMFADGASSKSRGTFEVFTPLCVIYVNQISAAKTDPLFCVQPNFGPNFWVQKGRVALGSSRSKNESN